MEIKDLSHFICDSRIKRYSRGIFLAIMLCLCAFEDLDAQFYTMDFDTTDTPVDGIMGVTLSTGPCFIDNNEYFNIVDDSNIQGSLMNVDGQYLGIRDIANTCSADAVDMIDIDISGRTDMYFCFDVAELDATDGDEDWDTTDEIDFQYSIDGGAYVTVASIQSTGNGANNAPSFDCDMDNTGDGDNFVTNTFTTYCFPIIGTGSEIDLRISIARLTAADEDIAIDNIELYEGSASLPGNNPCTACPIITGPPVTYDGCTGDAFSVTVNSTLYDEANPTGTETFTTPAGCDSTITITLIYEALPGIPSIMPIEFCFGDGTSTELIPMATGGTIVDPFSVLWDFEGEVDTAIVDNPDVLGGDFSSGAGLASIEYFAGNGSTDSYSTTNWNDEATDYYEFCITADAKALQVNTLSFDDLASSTAPTSFSIFTSNDSYTTAIGTGSTHTTWTANSLTGIDIDVALGSQLCFRIFATGASGTSGRWRLDNVTVGGSTIIPSTGVLFSFFSDMAGTPITGAQEVMSYDPGVSSPGVYQYWLAAIDGNCSSDTISTTITIKDNSTGSETHDGCEGDGYEITIDGMTFNEATPMGMVTLPASNGCDSVITVDLNFKPNATGSETHDGCEGDGYEITIDGMTFNEATPMGMVTLPASNGCDSVITVDLNFKPNATGSETHDGCEGDGYEITIDGMTFNEATPMGMVTLPASNGCDSVITVDLNFKPNATGSETHDGCEGDGYEITIDGMTFNEATPMGMVTLPASNGCDSVITVDLNFKPNATGSETHVGCEGDGYEITIDGMTFNEATPMGMVTLPASNGCDSVITVDLNFKPNATGSETHDGCEGDGYEITIDGMTFNEATPMGMVTLPASNGCDSVITVDLNFKPNATGSETHDGCEGDGYEITIDGMTFNEATPMGMVTLTASNGCDSVVTVDLNFAPLPDDPMIAPIEFCFGQNTSTEIIPAGSGGGPIVGDPFMAIWNFEGEVLTGLSNQPEVTAQDAAVGSDLSTISFPAGDGSTDALSARNWNGEPGDYFEFCVNAVSSDILINEFKFADQASGTGPTSFSLFSSADGFVNSIGSSGTHGSFATNTIGPLTITINQGSQLCFRITGSGASSAAGTFRVDDVTISGNLTTSMAGATLFNFFSDATGTQIAGAQGVASYDPGVSAPGTYNYWVAATDGMCTSDTVMTTITINETPQISGTNDTICAGESVLLSDFIEGTISGTVNYGNAIGNYPNDISTSVSPITTTTYFIRDSIEATGCIDTAMITVLVNPQPEIQGMELVICEGDTIKLENSISGTTVGSLRYGTTLGIYPDTITTFIIAATDATYYIQDSSELTGCVDTALVNVTVLPIARSNNDITRCAGDGFSITVGTSTYDEMNLSGIDTLDSAAANGCDSIVTTTLTFITAPNPGTTTNTTACSSFANAMTGMMAMVDLDDHISGNDAGTWNQVGSTPQAVTIGANNEIDFEGTNPGTYTFQFTVTGNPPCMDGTVTMTVEVMDCPDPCDGFDPPMIDPIQVCFGDGSSTLITPNNGGFGIILSDPFTATWDFEGEALTGVSDQAAVTASNAVTGADLSSVSFPAGDGSTDALSARNWNDEAGDYFEFCINAVSSDIIVDGLSFSDQASGTGPTTYSVFSSNDGFSVAVGSGNTHSSFATNSISSLGITIAQGAQLCFRITATGASSTSGTLRVDNVVIFGNLTTPPTNPVVYNFFSDATGTQIAGAQGVASYDPGVSAPGTYNYWVAATDGMCTSDTVMTTITINETPQISGTNDTICAGESVLLSDFIEGTISGTVNYGNAIGNYPNDISTSVSPITTTTYFIRDSIEATGCIDTAMITVLVNPQPEIQGMELVICEGDTIKLENSISGTTVGSLRYGTTLGSYPDTISTFIVAATDATYYIQDSSELTGCVDTALVNVTVLPIARSNNDITRCAGDGFSITVGTSTYDEMNLSGIDTLDSAAANGCDSIVTTTLTFITAPNPGTTTNTTACSSFANAMTGMMAMVDLDDHISGNDAGTWNQVGSTPQAVTIDANNEIDFEGTNPGTYTFQFTVTGNPPCMDGTVTMTVEVMDCPDPCDGFDPPMIDPIVLCFGDGSSTLITPTNGGFGIILSDPFTATWDFEGEALTGVSDQAAVTASNAVTGADLSSVSFPAGDGSTDALSARNWNNEAGDYFEFCINAVSSDIIFDGISFADQASGTGPTAFLIYTSNDGFTDAIAAGDTHASFTTNNFNSFAIEVAQGSQLCLRFVGLIASSTSGTWRVDNVVLSGNLTIPPINPVVYNFFSDATGTQIATAQGVPSYDPGVSAPGTYNYWVAATDGMCTSDTVMTMITIYENETGTETYNGCQGDGYQVTVNGNIYNETNPTGMDTLVSRDGCDSVVTVNLIFKPNATGSETYEGCEGDGYQVTVNGVIYNETNPIGMETFPSSNGCDSIVSINLNFNPSLESPMIAPIEFCFGDDTSTELIPENGAGDPVIGEPFNVLWDFEGEVLTGLSDQTAVTASDAVAGADLSSISFPAGDGSIDALSARNWNNEAGDYFEFCINAVSSDIIINELSFADQASGTGPSTYSIFTSNNGFSVVLASGNTHSSFTTNTINSLEITIDQGTQLCFRITATGASSTSGTLRVDDLVISGNLTTPPINPIVYNFFFDAMGTEITGAQGVASYDPSVTAPGTYNYWVTATDGMCFSDTVMTTITINESPEISGTNDTICAGESVLLSDFIEGIISGTVNYGTDFGNYPNDITSLASPSSTTTYFIRDSIEATGCIDTALITVVVHQQPEIQGMDLVICEGDSVSLEDWISGTPSGSLRYGTTFGTYTDTITQKVAPTQDTRYFIIDSVLTTGCTDTTFVDVIINDAPDIQGSDATFCRADSILLSDFISGLGVGDIRFGTVFGNYPDTITTKVSPSDITTYYIIESFTATGCNDTTHVTLTPFGPEIIPPGTFFSECPASSFDLSTVVLEDIWNTPGDANVTFYDDSSNADLALAPLSESVISTSGQYFIRYEIEGCFSIAPIEVIISKCCTLDLLVEETTCFNDGTYEISLNIDATDPCGEAFALLVDGIAIDTISYAEALGGFSINQGVIGLGTGSLVISVVDTTNLNQQENVLPPFISEIHYDNQGGDVNEGVEVSGTRGQDLTGYQIITYNGSNGAPYGTPTEILATLPSGNNRCASLFIPLPGLQNGPDGLALISPSGAVIEFLSYEGSFTATSGLAAGMTSTDIMVSESTSSNPTHSLQLLDGGWTGPLTSNFNIYNNGLSCDREIIPPVCQDEIIFDIPFCPTDCDLGITPVETICLDDGTFQLKFELDYFNPLSDSFLVIVDNDTIATLPYPNESGDTICIDLPIEGLGMKDIEFTIRDKASTILVPGVIISEIHYDNDGTDENEGVEITAPTNQSLEGYELVLYNGADGGTYRTIELEGVAADDGNGCGAIFFEMSSLQNGPDGLALVDPSGNVLSFLSYEGSFVATDGPALDMTSTDIGIAQGSSNSSDETLQLTNTGWLLSSSSRNMVNSDLSCIEPSVENICETSILIDAPDCPRFELTVDKNLITDPFDISPGDTISFEIVIANEGDGTAFDIEIQDNYPENLIFSADINDNGWNEDGLFQNISSLAPGEDTVLIISFIVSPNATNTSITNTASIAFSTLASGGPNVDNIGDGTLSDDPNSDQATIAICFPMAVGAPIIEDVTICDPENASVLISPQVADSIVLDEDFEDAVNGVDYFTSRPEFSDGEGDYFILTDGTNTNVDDNDLKNISGTTWFGAQDIDGEGGNADATILFPAKDITGLCNLSLSISLAEDDASNGDEDWDGSTNDNNFVHIDYSIDGGPFINGIHIESSSTGLNTEPRIDTDFDGVGDGPEIIDSFQNFTILIPNNGGHIQLRISMNLDDGDEDIAIDDILIKGSTPLYNFYDGNPLTDGTVIESGVIDFTVTNPLPGSETTYWATSICGTCEGPPTPFTVVAHDTQESIACFSEVNVAVNQDCSIEDLDITALYGSDIAPEFMEVIYKDMQQTEIDPSDISNYVNQSITYNLTDTCTGISCWGIINLEAKTLPLQTIIRDTLCCSFEETIEILSEADFLSQLNDLCIPKVRNINLISSVSGSLCDTLINTHEYRAKFDIDGTIIDSLIYIHEVYTVSFDDEAIVFPGSGALSESLARIDTIEIEACGDFSFTPIAIADYWSNLIDPNDQNKNGNNDGYPFALPYITKDSITIEETTTVFQVTERIVADSLIKVNDIWIQADVVVKDTFPIIQTDFRKVPDYISFEQGDFCNLSIKYTDTYDQGCFEKSKLLREWTILDWCDGSIRSDYQYIIVKDITPPDFNVINTTVTIINPDSIIINGSSMNMSEVATTTEIDFEKLFQIINIYDPQKCTASFEVPIFDKLVDNCTSLDNIRYSYTLNGLSVTPDPNNLRLIHDIPIGNSELKITATDLCGNSADHVMTIFAADKAPPRVICKDKIHVTLTEDQGKFDGGRVLVPLDIFDIGTVDECGEILFILGQRLDNKFLCNGTPLQFITTDSLEFCCEDIGIDIPIKLTFFDAAGNSSECWTTVLIEDKFKPEIKIEDISVSCHAEYHPRITGYPEVTTICSGEDLVYSDDNSAFDDVYNRGYILRSWYLEDQPEHQVIQRIDINNDGDYKFDPKDIQWPRHYNGQSIEEFLVYEMDNDSCVLWVNPPNEACFEHAPLTCADEILDTPHFTTPKCDLIATSYEDLIFGDTSSCAKIIRKWTIIDWCTYKVNQQNNPEHPANLGTLKFVKDKCLDESYYRYDQVPTEGIYIYEQEIKIIDTEQPEIQNTDSLRFNVDDQCVSSFTVFNSAVDNGNCSSQFLHWRLTITDESQQPLSIFETESHVMDSVTFAVQRLTKGTYHFNWKVSDLCGNEDSTWQVVIVGDDIAPEAYCISDISTAFMRSDQTFSIWASDFAPATSDNCDRGRPYFKHRDGTITSNLIVSCFDIPSTDGLWTGQLYFIDDSGNESSCNIQIQVSNYQEICVNLSSVGSISGNIYTPLGNMVEGVIVNTRKENGSAESMTNINGAYAFNDLVFNKDYLIDPSKNDDLLNGVNVVDLVIIQRHILGIASIESPYLKIAADVNKDGKISVTDMANIRAAILGYRDYFEGNESWRFIDTDHEMVAEQYKELFPETKMIQDLNSIEQDVDFTGIKIADVDASVIANSGIATNRSETINTLAFEDRLIEKGEETKVIFTFEKPIDGFQIDMYLKVAGTFANAGATSLNINEKDVNILGSHLKLLYPLDQNEKGEKASFFVVLKLESSALLSDVISLDQNQNSISYEANKETTSIISLLKESSNGLIRIAGAQPNPFKGSTIIPIEADHDGTAVIRVYSLDGRLVQEQVFSYKEGNNEYLFNNKSNEEGVLIYQISTDVGTYYGKIISVR